MKFKNSIAFAIAICAVFMFTGIASAANHVTLKTTVPNLAKSDCDQAGTITMEFDSGTEMEEGDVIQFTLNNDVTVCKAIDYFLALADDGTQTGNPDGTIISNNTADPITDNDAGNVDLIKVNGKGVAGGGGNVAALGAGTLTIDGTAAVVGFRVYAPAGSQVITMTLGYIEKAAPRNGLFKVRTGTGIANNFVVSYAPVKPETIMSIKLFDEKNNTNYFYEDLATSTTVVNDYLEAIELEDNVMCINTTKFSYEYVGATPDSIIGTNAYKLGFSGDYTVAHVVAADSYVIQNVCKDACPTVSVSKTTDQFGVATEPNGLFDTGNYDNAAATTSTLDRWNSSGTCNTTFGNGVILRRVGTNFNANQKFTVQLQLLIDGVAADASVVSWNTGFAGANQYNILSSDAGRCSKAGTPMTAAGAPAWTYASTSNAIINATLTADTAHDAFVLDLPVVKYDYKKLVAGAKLEVKVTFGKFPCGGTTTATLCMATFTSGCASTDAYTLLYPFATGSTNASFWSGLVITNTSAKAATATITLYDTKGGSGSLAVSIDAKAQYTKVIGDIVSAATFVNGTKALDTASDIQIEVKATEAVDGLMFVGATGVMHGYLPRVFKNNVVQH